MFELIGNTRDWDFQGCRRQQSKSGPLSESENEAVAVTNFQAGVYNVLRCDIS